MEGSSCTGPIVEESRRCLTDTPGNEPAILAELTPLSPTTRMECVPRLFSLSGPGFETDNNLRLINYLIYNAERRITIRSPYFVPEETLLQALTNAAYLKPL